VVNARGEAIGIATSVLSRTAPVAIPRATVDRVSAQLASHGRVARGYLGVGMQEVPLPENLGTRGLIVLSVEKDSPAERGGMVIGDILIALGGHNLKDTRDVQAFLTAENIGKTVPATIIRGGKQAELSLTVGEK
jgi:S1-C subfamily serine protease